jgi:hypothetical protein
MKEGWGMARYGVVFLSIFVMAATEVLAVAFATHRLTEAYDNRAYTQGPTWERGASPVNFR